MVTRTFDVPECTVNLMQTKEACLNLLIRGSAGLALIAFLCVSARAYNSDYFFTRAELGPKTVNDYYNLISGAMEQNPYQNEGSLKISALLQKRNEWEDARHALLKSAAGVNHWQGWELQGIGLERLAFTDAGTLKHAERAAELYDRVLKVNPSYAKGIERRALLGLKLGEWDVVRCLAERLLALDANNRNAIYLRARIAEGLNDLPLALDLYAEISAGGAPPSGSWFASAEITEKLKVLSMEEAR